VRSFFDGVDRLCFLIDRALLGLLFTAILLHKAPEEGIASVALARARPRNDWALRSSAPRASPAGRDARRVPAWSVAPPVSAGVRWYVAASDPCPR
jgi:hypothetical protein